MAPTSPRARHRVHGFQSLGAPSLFVHLLFNDRPILRLFVPRRCSSRRKKSPWTRGRKMPVKYGRRYYCRIMPVCPGDSSIVDRIISVENRDGVAHTVRTPNRHVLFDVIASRGYPSSYRCPALFSWTTTAGGGNERFFHRMSFQRSANASYLRIDVTRAREYFRSKRVYYTSWSQGGPPRYPHLHRYLWGEGCGRISFAFLCRVKILSTVSQQRHIRLSIPGFFQRVYPRHSFREVYNGREQIQKCRRINWLPRRRRLRLEKEEGGGEGRGWRRNNRGETVEKKRRAAREARRTKPKELI